MARCLVVGGSGYIGRELCRQLVERGDEVYALGRSDHPSDVQGQWLKGDITQTEGLQRALGDRRFDVIYHTASLPVDTGNPLEMVTVNLLGHTNVLVYARNTKVRRFVLTSSIAAYEWFPATKFSPPEYMPVNEEHPTRPKDMYASTKRMQEILAMTFHHQYGLPVTALRVTAVVGPRARGGGYGWRKIAEQLKEGKKVEIPHFSMDELCHYVDVRDVARMHIIAGEHPNAIGQIFNCVGPAPTLGSEMAAVIQRLFPGINVAVGFPWSMAQGGKIAFDMSKARRLLNFEPRYTFEDSIRSIKEWIDAGGLEEEPPIESRALETGVKKAG